MSDLQKRLTKALLIVVLLVAGFFVTTCTYFNVKYRDLTKPDEDRDITRLREYVGGYLVDGIYEITNEVFLVKRDPASLALGDALYAVGDKARGYTGETLPKSMAEYKENPTRWPRITAVISPGTKVQVRKIIMHQSFEYSYSYTEGIIFLDKTILEVSLYGLSVSVGDGEGPNPAFLKLVEPRNSVKEVKVEGGTKKL